MMTPSRVSPGLQTPFRYSLLALWPLLLLALALLGGCGGDEPPGGASAPSPASSRNVNTRRDRPVLLPVPRSLSWTGATFNIGATTDIVSWSAGDTVQQQAVARIQQAAVTAGLTPLVHRVGSRFAVGANHIVLRPPNTAERGLYPELTTKAEAYLLTVTSYRVNVVALTSRGLFCAAQTLAQMLQSPSLDGCTIVDWPLQQFRAVHFTVNPGMYRDERIYPA
ncbi:MAG TPA: glycoside hydrolase family 20 zincin-like fold domain-containing protein, partial [Chloroflexota bacterium]|nr:glycoside hydrolase family 20 zincin-like fold domain-containing protein [Chloroflexota bacterium]